MPQKHLISLIVPNLNEERFLPIFLNSLLLQTYKDFEVIIVDGGSTDDSLKIIEEFKEILNLKVVTDLRRNIGYIRNVGAKHAKGEILFHTSSDTCFERHLLFSLMLFYHEHPNVVAISGRTFPLGTSIIAHLGYQLFDFLRYICTISPFPIHKYRPSGNFTTIKTRVFNEIGGFPEVAINEDGLFGMKMDDYVKRTGKRVVFHLGYYVGHHAKRFEIKGGVKTILFYIYVLGNLFPILKPLLNHIESRSAKVFKERSDLKTC